MKLKKSEWEMDWNNPKEDGRRAIGKIMTVTLLNIIENNYNLNMYIVCVSICVCERERENPSKNKQLI